MKRIFLLLLLVSPAISFAQKGSFTIKGKIGLLDAPARIFLGYKTDKGSFFDSADLKKGHFEFKGLIDEPIQAKLVLSYTGAAGYISPFESVAVYVEQGVINLNSADSLKNIVITGSAVNADFKKLNEALRETDKKMNLVLASLSNLPAEKKKDKEFIAEFMKGYMQRQHTIIEEQNVIRSNFIKQHPNSFVSLDALVAIDKFNPEYAVLAPLYNSLSVAVKNTNGGKAYANKLSRMKVMEPGVMALPFTQNDPEGKPLSLASFKGQYVLVDFWASWCHACRLENPNVVMAYDKYHEKGLEILSVSLDKTKEPWLKAIEKDGMPWKHVSDLKGWRNEVAVMYNIQAVPQNILIDKSGRIIAKNLKGEKLEAKLAAIFK